MYIRLDAYEPQIKDRRGERRFAHDIPQSPTGLMCLFRKVMCTIGSSYVKENSLAEQCQYSGSRDL
jgi:hypothetical protein